MERNKQHDNQFNIWVQIKPILVSAGSSMVSTSQSAFAPSNHSVVVVDYRRAPITKLSIV